MKNLQIVILKNVAYSILFFSGLTSLAQTDKIHQADSLFKAKQYTQSLELYQAEFKEKNYSSAMLLKMAYISEGLGKVGATLYYLKLYHLATDDEQALKKTEELAAKFKLTGYEINDANRAQRWLTKNRWAIQVLLCVVALALAAVVFFQRRQNQKTWGALAGLILTMGLLFYSNNFQSSCWVIISSDQTYLMDGPSAGAHVSSIVGEGNLLQQLSREDVWLKVKWNDKEVYIKENAVMKLSL